MIGYKKSPTSTYKSTTNIIQSTKVA